ncbi:hypothetical protein DLM76_12540 [Leptospira yasudae]|uniref:Antitoxin n=1 Tax=Leptospira yasudae TaxID=2202201 RepID=A0A5F2E976_9LEPT|nr:hypothetical protein [Leptospira yasudae]MBW0434546.1 hypothetical protein [Leptospira yasudae]RHX80237.1 hypothetical protein DLM77_10365 [Leptospira yasudae]RHX93820.1 hypothetical protein DLM76_12540 [Leptospira yasudae]TGK25637.1 hypothetical protein EHQ05_12115 [Leptospira yasudae]TGL75332.1 hypothetical protein EHQ72_16245 [Leptospira yasudae]
MIFHPQYIIDEKGKKNSVVLSIQEYKKILESLQELEDVRLYDEVKAKREKSVPLQEFLKARSGKKNKRRHV